MDQPNYQHDCDSCQYLGKYYGKDLYACIKNNKIETIIARYGNEGSQYVSGLIFALKKSIPALEEALARALSKGYDYDQNVEK